MSNDDILDQEIEVSSDQLAEEIERDPEFEAYLKEAASIPVPEGLADRIIAHTQQADEGDQQSGDKVVHLDSVRDRQQPSIRTRQRWVAMAASVLLVFGLVGVNYFGRDSGLSMEQRIVADLSTSLPVYNSMVVTHQVDPNIEANLHRMFENIGAKRVGDLGTVMYCETKEVGGSKAGIMVFPGEKGAITVVYVTDKKVDARALLADQDMEGVIWPERKGSVAIIGHPGETRLAEVESRVRNSVNWF